MAASAGGTPVREQDLAVAGVVHDVNQMLTVIAGRVELLRLRGTDGGADDLEVIALAARDAAAMLRRLTAGVGRAAAEGPASLRACLEAVVLVHRPPTGTWGVDDGASPWRLALQVEGDPATSVPAQIVREVVGNIVVNAVEAMGGGGRLALTAARRGDGVLVTVRDDGPGLAPEQRERIFAAGFSTRRGEARGVGLAACRLLLADWGGTVRAIEPAGPGAAFQIELPAAEAAPVVPADAAAALPPRALVVDDEPAVREVLAEVLGTWGVAVTTAADAGQARIAWSGGGFPVVLVDQSLPGEPGLELARSLAAAEPRPAIVLMTGLDRARELPAEAGSWCDAVVTKPLDFGGLRTLLARVAGRAPDVGPGEGS